MSNITVSVDEATYRSARIVAAEQGVSVSALVRNYLQSLRPAQSSAGARTLEDTFDWANPGYSAAERYTREQVNDRKFMRAEHEAALKAKRDKPDPAGA
jgi:Family of unknown function (DUF6364)